MKERLHPPHVVCSFLLSSAQLEQRSLAQYLKWNFTDDQRDQLMRVWKGGECGEDIRIFIYVPHASLISCPPLSSLAQEWGVNLHTKGRKLQLIRRLWHPQV